MAVNLRRKQDVLISQVAVNHPRTVHGPHGERDPLEEIHNFPAGGIFAKEADDLPPQVGDVGLPD